jgi:cell division protein FtsZ
MKIADVGLSELEKEVDAILVIPNDRLIAISGKEVGFRQAFAVCDEVLKQAVEGISDLITTPGMINVDFADIKSVMSNTGSALMGIGIAAGEGRAEKAALAAVNSPLLDLSISGARGVLFAISGGEDLSIHEIQEAAKVITESIDKDAKVIFGTIQDDRLKKGEMKVTVIATGFPTDAPKRSLFQKAMEPTISNSTKEEVLQAIKEVPKVEQKDYVKKTEDDLFVDDTDDWSTVPAFLRRTKK